MLLYSIFRLCLCVVCNKFYPSGANCSFKISLSFSSDKQKKLLKRKSKGFMNIFSSYIYSLNPSKQPSYSDPLQLSSLQFLFISYAPNTLLQKEINRNSSAHGTRFFFEHFLLSFLCV